MILNNKDAQIFVPDRTSQEIAISETTHMAIGAHQDDLEIMAYDGIVKCFHNDNNSFLGVVVTDGAGSPRSGIYADYSDDDMQKIRIQEQKKAAVIGEYGAVALLGYSSTTAKDRNDESIVEEIKNLIIKASPDIIYTHNLADKHDTHVAVVIKVIKAIRELPKNVRPQKLYGCEAWRSLDWMLDSDKVIFDVDKFSNLESALVEVFDSQISGGKRYDMATIGRRLANATFANPHATDTSKSSIYCMELTPLIKDDSINISQFVTNHIDKLTIDVRNRIGKLI